MKQTFTCYRVALITLTGLIGCSTAHGNDNLVAQTEHEKYTIRAGSNPAKPKVGATATYTLTIDPKPGFLVKVETPFKGKLSGSPNLQLTKKEFTNRDFVDPQAPSKAIRTTFATSTPGSHHIKADVVFFVCDDTLCERYKNSSTLNLQSK